MLISNIFLTHFFLSHHRTSCLDQFLFPLPKLYISFIQSLIPISNLFSFMGLLNLSWIFMCEISSLLRQVRTQLFCAFTVWPVSISASSMQILISKSRAIKYLALQQVHKVHIFAYFIPASYNDLLISGPSDHTLLVYLVFIAILIVTTSSWYFPHRYIYSPFLFQDYQQMINTGFLKAELQKILSLSEREATELHDSNTESLDGLAFFCNKFMARRHLKSLL